MKKAVLAFGLAAAILASGAFLYFSQDKVEKIPELPSERQFVAWWNSEANLEGEQQGSIEGGMATSSNFMLVTSPPSATSGPDPMAEHGLVPLQFNLAVPWVAATYNQSNGACAAVVEAYFAGQPNVPTRKLQAAEAALGDVDLLDSAADLNFVLRKYLRSTVRNYPFETNMLRRAIANYFPACLLLKDGDMKRVIVVKGYAEDKFVVHDPAQEKFDSFMTEEEIYSQIDTAGGKAEMVFVIP